MTALRFARQLMLMLVATAAMLLGACHDDGVITPPDNNGDTCCAVLKVVVTSGNPSAPVAGVQVALRKGMDVVTTKETNGDGVATFTNVCNAQYNVRLTKDGYAVAERGEIQITSCDTTRLAITMSATNSEPPRDTCCNSVLRIIPTDAAGTPISGAQVRITSQNGTVRTLESTLDGALFREVCRGTYAVRIAREGFKVSEFSIEIGCGVEKTERRMLERADGQPGDSCCDGRLTVGARDAGTGALLGGAVVKLWKGNQLLRTLTIGDRPVVFERLCQGTYSVSINREGYRGAEGVIEIRCNAPAEFSRDLTRLEGGDCCNNQVVIRLLDGRTRTPVANASVKLLRGGAVVQTVRSNADGVARFVEVCVGEYAVLAEREGYQPEDPRINVVCGQVAEATIVLMPKNTANDTCCNATIKMVVLDGGAREASPLAGVTVAIRYADRQIATGMTNADGVYQRGDLCDLRTYVVVLEKQGYQRIQMEVPVQECGVITKSVRMLPQ
jgi:hypothetical protein